MRWEKPCNTETTERNDETNAEFHHIYRSSLTKPWSIRKDPWPFWHFAVSISVAFETPAATCQRWTESPRRTNSALVKPRVSMSGRVESKEGEVTPPSHPLLTGLDGSIQV